MASLREESADSEGSSYSLSDNENLAPQKKKRWGRKAQWQDRHVADMVDVICSDDNFARKLIFIMAATGSVVTGTQPPSSLSFNDFLQNKIKSLRWVSWSAIFIGSYVTFVTFFRWPTYTAVSIQEIKFGRNSTSESAVAFLPHLIELNSTRQKCDVWTWPKLPGKNDIVVFLSFTHENIMFPACQLKFSVLILPVPDTELLCTS